MSVHPSQTSTSHLPVCHVAVAERISRVIRNATHDARLHVNYFRERCDFWIRKSPSLITAKIVLLAVISSLKYLRLF